MTFCLCVQNSNPVPNGSANSKGWFGASKSNPQQGQGTWFRGKNNKSAQSGQKLFRSLSMPAVKS